jgi:hypothetical protein
MIVRILSPGKSFKGLASYLTNDPEAKTAERVGWTHTLNLAHDHVSSAVDEMLWTSRNAELLKQEAGIRAGGRATENTVKHISLNWSPDETPTKDHMIETAEAFLRHMNWHEHQALIVSHEDRPHPHAHLMLSAVHPETGLRLDDNFERRRAQTWALQYEQENGRVFCEQRLKNVEEREDAPTRPAWMAFQKNQIDFENQEINRENQAPIIVEELNNPDAIKSAEWNKLKEIQRHERITFFAEGKLEFSELRQSIYREIRDEFRERWSDYYTQTKEGGELSELAAAKQALIAEQKAALDARRDDACEALRASRDERYQTLLDDQREARYGLGARQEAGFDNAPLLYLMEEGKIHGTRGSFQEAASEATKIEEQAEPPEEAFSGNRPERNGSGMKSGADIGVGVGTGLGFAVISFFDGLADGLIGGKPAPKPRPVEPSQPRPDPFDGVIAAARERERAERLQADEDESRKKQRSYGE